MSRPAPKHAPRIPFALLLLGLIVGGLAVMLVLNTASAANELRRHDVGLRDSGVSARIQHLRSEIARSQAPGNLAQAAARLGMVPAGNPAFVQIGPDGKVTVLGSPAPVTGPAAPPPTHPHPSTHPHTSTHTRTPTHPRTTPAPKPTTTLPGGAR